MTDGDITYVVMIDDPRLDERVTMASTTEDPVGIFERGDSDQLSAAIELARQNLEGLALHAARDWGEQRHELAEDPRGEE